MKCFENTITYLNYWQMLLEFGGVVWQIIDQLINHNNELVALPQTRHIHWASYCAVRGKKMFGCLLFASREVQGYKRVWSSTPRGFLQVKRDGRGHRIWVTFPALHLQTCPLQWHPGPGGGEAGSESRAWLSMCYLIPVQSEHPATADPQVTVTPASIYCHAVLLALEPRGHDVCDLLLKGKIVWVEPCYVLAGHWPKHPLFPCHPLHGYLGSSQPSECGSVLNKLLATLLWSHILRDSVELRNFFWESLQLHPMFSEYSTPDKFFPFF